MGWTTYDISEITEALVQLLKTAVQNSPLWTSEGGLVPNFLVNVSDASPDTMRNAKEGECQLTLYLLHVGQDPFFRNTPIYGTSAMANTQQPLSLNLSYLLTAYAPDNALREQQAMSIALAYFHENPIYTGPPDPMTGEYQYLTVGLGTDTLSEMSALWQSFTVAYRLSTIYRVAVAFITPSQAPGTPKPKPTKMGLAVGPAAELATTPQIFQPLQQIVFTPPAGADTNAGDVGVAPGPLVMQAGVQILLGGQGLAPTPPLDIVLSSIDGSSSWSIAGWQSEPPTNSIMTLTPPASYAIGGAPAPPSSTPPPGVYLLAVKNGTTLSPGVPVLVAPVFSNVANPVLQANGGSYSFSGAGFVPGATQLFVDGIQLDAGAVTIDSAGTSVSFTLPATLPHGTAALRVRVDGIDAPPTLQVAA
jgi:hypothetical protein